MSIYLSNPDGPPDSDFEPGALHHLVVGNQGRLLDSRRTPVSIVGVQADVGFFDVRIDDFEDVGARWAIPVEKVHHYQFTRGAARASASDVGELNAAIARFDRTISIACDQDQRERTLKRLAEERRVAAAWLDAESRFFREGGRLPEASSRRGDDRLCGDLRAFLESHGVGEIESAFARQYVSNPDSGELVKGHRIVLAELGLASYEGQIVRGPTLFDGAWSRACRADHLLFRLAFVQAMFNRLGHRRVVLFRGVSSEEPLSEAGNRTFVSATFDEAVARSHYEAGTEHATRVLMRQSVPAERIFMTYLETAEMNEHFREAEAVLFYDPETRPF